MVMSIRLTLSAKHTMAAGGSSTMNTPTSETGSFQVCIGLGPTTFQVSIHTVHLFITYRMIIDGWSFNF